MVRKADITVWAWVVSITVHLCVLGAFGAVKLSGLNSEQVQNTQVSAKIKAFAGIINTEMPIPKPKVREFLKKEPVEKKQSEKIARNTDNSQTSKDFSDLISQTKSDISLDKMLPSGAAEFFGGAVVEKKICFVVDSSGSMKGVLGLVKKHLCGTIDSLGADQYFYIIFFGNQRLFELGDGRLMRASEENKKKAVDFINSIQEAGATDAIKAFERMLEIRDNSGNRPGLIYFLTDGFEIASEGDTNFESRLNDLISQLAPTAKINTIDRKSVV